MRCHGCRQPDCGCGGMCIIGQEIRFVNRVWPPGHQVCSTADQQPLFARLWPVDKRRNLAAVSIHHIPVDVYYHEPSAMITENYPMRQRLTLLDLVEKHQLLDDAIREDRKHFVSDWNGTHPFVSEFLGPEILTRAVVTPDQARYLYFDEELDVLDAVRKLHETREGLSLSRENVLAGPGSSSLLTALCLWILHQGYREVYYIPPLYYTLHYFLRMLTVRPRPVTGKHAFEIGAALNLPAKKALLQIGRAHV